jgi:small conductance mechanosensitive channel
MAFSTDVDQITQLIREVGADLMADFRYRREMLGPIEVWGLDRFDPNWMVVKGQIKTRPLQQWSVARAFNLRLKRKMDEAGIEIPVPQMRVYTSSKDSEGQPLQDDEMSGFTAPVSHESAHAHAEAGVSARAPHGPLAVARDVSHEPRPAPPPTGQTASIPPQIPTAGEAGGKSG